MSTRHVLGLLGVDALTPHLRVTGRFELVTGTSLQDAAKQLNASARWQGRFPTLVLNDPRLQDLIPKMPAKLDVTVLGTQDNPAVEQEGLSVYQLPGSVRDVLKQMGYPPEAVSAVPETLEFTGTGAVIDVERGWDDWTPPTARAKASTQVKTRQRTTADVDDEEVAEEVGDVFGAAASVRRAVRGGGHRTGLGEVVFALSGVGGAGKSMFSIALASRAGIRGRELSDPLNVVLFDNNLGQPDQATYLKVGEAPHLPTMFDAVLANGDLTKALITPPQLNQTRDARSSHLEPLEFALVQGPSAEDLRTGRLTARFVHDLIEKAREIAHLVVVDCQIVENDDLRGMVDGMLLPQLGKGGWAVALMPPSSAGVANLLNVLQRFREEDVPPGHLLSVMSRYPEGIDVDDGRLRQALQDLSIPIGTIWEDPTLIDAMNRGRSIANHPAIAPVVDVVLQRIFAMEPIAQPRPDDSSPVRRLGRFRRRPVKS